MTRSERRGRRGTHRRRLARTRWSQFRSLGASSHLNTDCLTSVRLPDRISRGRPRAVVELDEVSSIGLPDKLHGHGNTSGPGDVEVDLAYARHDARVDDPKLLRHVRPFVAAVQKREVNARQPRMVSRDE